MTFTIVQLAPPTAPATVAATPARSLCFVGWLRQQAPAHLLMMLFSAFAVLPLIWLVATAFADPASIAGGQIFGSTFSLANFEYVFSAIPLLEMLDNTAVMAISIAAAQLLVAVLAAYGFAVFEFRGRKLLYLLFVSSWLVPFQVTMIPNYLLISHLGLLNSIAGVVVPNLCSAFAVLMLRQHVMSIPRELIDAAAVDGRGSWTTLWLVVVPNLLPAIASLGVILVISAWNEYTWPLLVMQRETSVVQVGIRAFLGSDGDNWGAVMAASGLACLPIFALYLFLQRHIVSGFVRSGLK